MMTPEQKRWLLHGMSVAAGIIKKQDFIESYRVIGQLQGVLVTKWDLKKLVDDESYMKEAGEIVEEINIATHGRRH